MGFEQNKILYWLVVILLITNIALVGTLVYQNAEENENGKYAVRYSLEIHGNPEMYIVIDNKLGVFTRYSIDGEILEVIDLKESVQSILD